MPKLTKALEYLLYLFVFLLPWQTRFIYQEAFVNGQPFEYGRLSLYATEILLGLIIVLGIIFILRKIKTEKPKITFHKSKRRMLVLLGGLILLVLNISIATNPEIAFYKTTYLILGLCFFFVLLLVKPDFKKLSLAFIYSSLFQSLLALQQFSLQKVEGNKWLGMATQDPNDLGTPVVLTTAGRWLRSFGALPHPNILAGFLLIALILIMFLSFREEIKTSKRNLNLLFVITFLGIITTLSKAAIICAFIVFIYMLFVTKAHEAVNKKINRFALIALAVIVFFTASYPELVISRVTNSNTVEQRSYNERISQYSEWATVMKSNLFFGTGLGNYSLYLQKIKPNLEVWDYQPMHNVFLLILAEIGVVPLLYIIGLSIYFKQHQKIKQISISLISTLALSIIFLMLFDHYWWSFYSGLMLVAFVIASTILSKKYLSETK